MTELADLAAENAPLREQLREIQQDLREIKAAMVSIAPRQRSGTIRTPEAAMMLGLDARKFRDLHVKTGNIQPVPGHKSIFRRADVERLRQQATRQR